MTRRKVTLYTKPGCVQCTATKRWLDKNNVEYTPIDVSKDAEALAKVKALGYEAVPVTVAETSDPTMTVDWYGFNDTNLAKYTRPKAA